MTDKQAMTIEARDIHLPRITRIKKMIDTAQLTSYFNESAAGGNDGNDERDHWMLIYALVAAFDADITREAFTELATDVLNLRTRQASCNTLAMAHLNQKNAHLTPELLSKSFAANKAGCATSAADVARQLALIDQCRGHDDSVN